MAHQSHLIARGSRLAARGSRLAARGSRLAARGSRLAEKLSIEAHFALIGKTSLDLSGFIKVFDTAAEVFGVAVNESDADDHELRPIVSELDMAVSELELAVQALDAAVKAFDAFAKIIALAEAGADVPVIKKITITAKS